MTKEELMKKIEKEEKWLIHALNDQTDVTSQYSVDIAIDAVKHYVKDYIDSQQKMGRWEEYYTWQDPMTPRYRCSICQEPMEKVLDGNQLVEWWSDYCPNCGAKMGSEKPNKWIGAEALDKIRAEIDQYLFRNEFGSAYREEVSQIIDKYKVESEVQE